MAEDKIIYYECGLGAYEYCQPIVSYFIPNKLYVPPRGNDSQSVEYV
jgi:hypothetical protein